MRYVKTFENYILNNLNKFKLDKYEEDRKLFDELEKEFYDKKVELRKINIELNKLDYDIKSESKLSEMVSHILDKLDLHYSNTEGYNGGDDILSYFSVELHDVINGHDLAQIGDTENGYITAITNQNGGWEIILSFRDGSRWNEFIGVNDLPSIDLYLILKYLMNDNLVSSILNDNVFKKLNEDNNDDNDDNGFKLPKYEEDYKSVDKLYKEYRKKEEELSGFAGKYWELDTKVLEKHNLVGIIYHILSKISEYYEFDDGDLTDLLSNDLTDEINNIYVEQELSDTDDEYYSRNGYIYYIFNHGNYTKKDWIVMLGGDNEIEIEMGDLPSESLYELIKVFMNNGEISGILNDNIFKKLNQ